MATPFYNFVFDCSFVMTWCFKDEGNDFSYSILNELKKSKAIVPTIWPLEIANVLLIAKKKKRISEVEAVNFVDALSVLPISIDPSTTTRAMHSIYLLAGQYELTSYNAAYLELAIREKIPLLTFDAGLIKAAKKLQVQVNLV